MSFRVLIIPHNAIISDSGVDFVSVQMSQPLPYYNAAELAKSIQNSNRVAGNQTIVKLMQTTMIEIPA